MSKERSTVDESPIRPVQESIAIYGNQHVEIRDGEPPNTAHTNATFVGPHVNSVVPGEDSSKVKGAAEEQQGRASKSQTDDRPAASAGDVEVDINTLRKKLPAMMSTDRKAWREYLEQDDVLSGVKKLLKESQDKSKVAKEAYEVLDTLMTLEQVRKYFENKDVKDSTIIKLSAIHILLNATDTVSTSFLKRMPQQDTDDGDWNRFMKSDDAEAVRLLLYSDTSNDKKFSEFKNEFQKYTDATKQGQQPPTKVPDIIKSLLPVFVALKFRPSYSLSLDINEHFSTLSTPLKASVGFAVFLVIFGALYAIILTIKIQTDWVNNQLLKNPINRDAFTYKIAFIASNILTTKGYNYVPFLLIPWIGLLVSAYAVYKIFKATDPVPVPIKLLVLACLLQFVMSAIINTIVFMRARKRMKTSETNIKEFNKYVSANMFDFTNVQSPLVLINAFQRVQPDIVSSMKIVRTALKEGVHTQLDDEANSKKIANCFFSLNIYMHLQKLGAKNPATLDALKTVFGKTNILNSISGSKAADFMSNRTTYIQDYTQLYITIIKRKLTLTPKQDNVLNSVSVLTAEMTANANAMANTFYLDNNLTHFFVLEWSILISQLLIFILGYLAILLYQKSQGFHAAVIALINYINSKTA